MISVYCQHESHARILAQPALAELTFLPCRDWRRFERAMSRSLCSLLLLERLAHDQMLARLAGLRHRLLFHPLVLVTRKEPENLRLLGDIGFDRVVWFQEVERSLGPAIHRARSSGYLLRLAEVIGGAGELPPRLRSALRYACQKEGGVRTIVELAAEVGCDRSTLCRQWRKGVGAGVALRLEDFVDWLTLLRAVGRRAPGRKWSAVAAELNVEERTLGRTARRLAGQELGQLDLDSFADVAVCFEQRALTSVLGVSCNIVS